MPEFGTPFSGLSLGRGLTDAELIRALRFSIAAEYEAIQLYVQIAEATDNEEVADVLRDIANEEVVHAGEFLSVLKSISPNEKKLYRQGSEEVKEMKALVAAAKKRFSKRELQTLARKARSKQARKASTMMNSLFHREEALEAKGMERALTAVLIALEGDTSNLEDLAK